MPKTFLFDIDHTLYPHSQMAEDALTDLIDAFLVEEQGMQLADAQEKRERYYTLFGTTLAGLLYYDEIDAQKYIAYKERFPLEVLDFDPASMALIRNLDARLIAITNSHQNHGERVLRHLGIRDKFEKIYGIEQMGFWGKPFRKSFHMVFDDAAIAPRETIFFEDSARNLAYPKSLGMTTILINEKFVPQGQAPDFVDYHVANLSDAMEIALAL